MSKRIGALHSSSNNLQLQSYIMKYSTLSMAAILSAALFFSSCAAPIVPRQAQYNEADFARTSGAGSGSVTGQVFLTMKSNTTRVGANVTLVLLPVNAYTTETIQRKYEGGENLADGDPRYYKHVRAVQSDGQGYFAFRQIPSGDYYVGGTVVWSHWIWNTDGEGVMYKITINRSTKIYARVSVENGRSAKVTQWIQGKSKEL
jgi:hypothetical protein